MNTPGIFNSDQGVQFTSCAFTSRLQAHDVRISMDGVGRCFDNIMAERLWRSVKYEEVYLKDYRSLPEARSSISDYFAYYNLERPHQSQDYRTPYEVYHNLEWGSSDSILAPSTLTQNLSNILS